MTERQTRPQHSRYHGAPTHDLRSICLVRLGELHARLSHLAIEGLKSQASLPEGLITTKENFEEKKYLFTFLLIQTDVKSDLLFAKARMYSGNLLQIFSKLC